MQIIVPMSGFGERFRRAHYRLPKPLIEIDGKPIIAHVIDMFPGEEDFLFICNREHLEDPSFQMEAVLRKYCPTGRIVGIEPHKLGPIHAVMQVRGLIDPERSVIVNYCDFSCLWDWPHFKDFLRASGSQGAVPAYRGFHPHSLGTTNYAYMREEGGWLLDIQEKQPFTDNRLEEYASSGTYYFASGQLMCQAFLETMEQSLAVNGEYYVSLAYKALLRRQMPVSVYPLQHFMQWGTPEDVDEYKGWSSAFRRMVNPPQDIGEPLGTVLMPMAGLGQRFVNEGYQVAKPLIPVCGVPMVLQAVDDLPPAKRHVFVARYDMPDHEGITQAIVRAYPEASVVTIPNVTEGQACSALLGVDALQREFGEFDEPLTIGACDHGALYDARKLARLMSDPDIDVIVWGVSGHANAIRKPEMFGWISVAANGRVDRISVKAPLSSPLTDPIVLGTFTFKRAGDFRKAVDRLVARNGRINGEFYIDACINDAVALGLRCHLFEVDSFLSWGTPNDLRTFEYWQSCFHKWPAHPYRLEKDPRIPPQALEGLRNRYRLEVPLYVKAWS